MTGSDQVWNTVVCGEIDPVYFLSFLPKEAKKIAYAASFGGASVAEKDKARIKSWLEEYDKVTVRENSGIKIASELGIHAEQVLDPTFCSIKTNGKSLFQIVNAMKSMCLYISFTQISSLMHTQKSLQKEKG